MKTLEEYCNQLGWNTSNLASQAGINYRTAKKALEGDIISSRSAQDIAKALTRAMGNTINVGDIRGLVIKHQ